MIYIFLGGIGFLLGFPVILNSLETGLVIISSFLGSGVTKPLFLFFTGAFLRFLTKPTPNAALGFFDAAFSNLGINPFDLVAVFVTDGFTKVLNGFRGSTLILVLSGSYKLSLGFGCFVFNFLIKSLKD